MNILNQNKKTNRVLLIYPALFKITGVPLGLASLSAALKKGGYQVKVFDTAFYDLNKKDEEMLRAGRLTTKKISNEEEHWKINVTDVREDLIKLIKEFQPLLVGISIEESNYELGFLLTRFIKQHFKDLLIIAGGVSPTLSPDIVIKENSLDIICLGEGETALVELCDRISTGNDYNKIAGLWIKKNGNLYKNDLLQLHNINELPHPDFTAFNEKLFYKPMQGRLYKMISVETSRGCPYKCSYCSAAKLKQFYLKNECGKYYRNMSMEKVIEQIRHQIDIHSPEFIYFSSETFLAVSNTEFDIFIKEYRKIGIPFWFQTRFETMTDHRIKALKDVGMFWLTLGVEHGNEKFRKEILKRNYTNKMIIEGIKILNNNNFGASLNNMIGFPFENRELIFDTINLNKELYKLNKKLEFNVWMFVPFRGCELFDLCEENHLLPDESYFTTTEFEDESVLNFSNDYKRDLKGLMKTFNLYVKLPEKYYPQIKIAEQNDDVGNRMFKELSQIL